MYSIAEVAQYLNVHTQTLRNWERNGLIIPKRIGKVRVYSDLDVIRCQEIKKYSGRGVNLRGIRELLRLNGRDYIG